MSETTNEIDIQEITDSSINIEVSPVQDNANKRRLSEAIEDELQCEKKKFCNDSEAEKIESTAASILLESALEEEEEEKEEQSKIEDETIICLDNTSKLLQTIDDKTEEEELLNATSESECVLDETQEPAVPDNKDKPKTEAEINKSDDYKNEELLIPSDEEGEESGVAEVEIAAEGDVENDEQEEDGGQNSIIGESDEEEDDDDYEDDEALMMRVNSNLPPKSQAEARKQIETNSEPIALDSDTEDEENSNIEEEHENEDSERSLTENEEGEEEEEEEGRIYDKSRAFSPKKSLRMRLLDYNPRFYYARKLVKMSVKHAWRKHSKEGGGSSSSSNNKNEIVHKSPETQNVKEAAQAVVAEKVTEKCTVNVEIQLPSTNSSGAPVAKGIDMQDTDVEMKDESSGRLGPTTTNDNEKKTESSKPEVDNEKASEKKTDDARAAIKEKSDDTKSTQNHNEPELETHFLLQDIQNSSVDEIMSKYVLGTSGDQSSSSSSQQPTLDEFSEELFFCLQQNKIEIQKLQQIWNEKVHLKFKIREIMERIRRHRAVTDIENFGFKPAHEGQQSSGANALIASSKSSTTNSENDQFERSSKLTSESVSRLIQDVKSNVLKKDQQRMDFSSAMHMNNDSFDDNSSFGLNAHMQSFGRQGQTIDVQSIINEFRQKNPHEIPRRGRRVKNSFEGNFMGESPSSFNKSDNKSNNVIKSNSTSGFPEVSLVPVNSFYKSNLNTPASSSPFGQKSSLLQSILTKQTTKSPIVYQQSSTLQRLLTAPERSFQGLSRQGHVNAASAGGGHSSSKTHNNGEITITPIAGTSRKQDFSMDDEENSTEPPLVIDESEDFELSERARELICQGCRKNKALFMCAGCSRQWYCSKECQELAWNDHENSCF